MVTDRERNALRSFIKDKKESMFTQAHLDEVNNRIAQQVVFLYTNYRGETDWRRVQPQSIYFGSTEYHKEPQWLLKATDLGKNAERDFAIKDIKNWGDENTYNLLHQDTSVDDTDYGTWFNEMFGKLDPESKKTGETWLKEVDKYGLHWEVHSFTHQFFQNEKKGSEEERFMSAFSDALQEWDI